MSKTTRVEPAKSEGEPVHFNLNFLPWRKESATRRSVESAVVSTAKVAGVDSEPETAPAPKGASYLPASGALPLRFSAARTWPDRMAPADEAALALALAPEPDLAILGPAAVAQGQGDGTVVPAGATTGGQVPGATGMAGGAVTVTAASTSAAQPSVIVARPAYTLAGEAILTADLVLHSLGNLSNGRGAAPARFQPAVPADHSLDSVPVAVAP